MYITYNHVCFLLQSGRDLDRTHTMARHNSAEWKWDGFWLTYKIDRSKTIEALQCHRCFKHIKDEPVHMCPYEDLLCLGCFQEIGAKCGPAHCPLCVWPLSRKWKSRSLEKIANMLPKDRRCRRNPRCMQTFTSLERLVLHEKEECPYRDRQCSACGLFQFPTWMATHMNLRHYNVSYNTLGETLRWACDGRTPQSRVIGMYTAEASRLEMFTVQKAVDDKEDSVYLWVSHSDFTTAQAKAKQKCEFDCKLALMAPNGKSELTYVIMHCSPIDAARGDANLHLDQSLVQTAVDKLGCFVVSICIFERERALPRAKQLSSHDGKSVKCLRGDCESDGNLEDCHEKPDPDFFG